jgi:hypothetical protein
MILSLLLLIPSDVVLAGLGDGATSVVTNADKVLTFTAGQQDWAIRSVKLYGDNSITGGSVTFRLRDSLGASLAFGGAFLNVDLALTGTDFDLSNTPIGAYGLSANTQYQLSMFVGNSLTMSNTNGQAFEAYGFTQDVSPGIKYSVSAAAVPEPGTLLMGAVLAALVAGGWWLWRF